MADTRLAKVGITVKEPWADDISYEVLDYVLWRVQDGGDGCGYIAKRSNIGIRPNSDVSVWAPAAQAGQSIYDLAVKYGHFEGTEEEFEAEYQAALQAARTAASEASATNEQIQSAERSRAEAESARVAAENDRSSHEEARIAAEENRSTAESQRAGAESQRSENESARQNNEQSRQTSESNRQSAETTRQNNETARGAAEQERNSTFQGLKTDMETARDQADAAAQRANTAAGRSEADHEIAEADHSTAESDHETAESDHETAETDHEIVNGMDRRVTDMQETAGAWRDSFKWDHSLKWPGKKSSGGGGGSVDAQVLKTMPTFKKKWRKANGGENFCYYEVEHPMMDNEDAEIVLVRYVKKNGKKHLDENEEPVRRYKKGFGLAVGVDPTASYFVFSKVTQYEDFASFCDEHFGSTPGGHFGIALRIPNPDYDGPETLHKNATYKGVPESLYSDVLPANVSYDEESEKWGIGLI